MIVTRCRVTIVQNGSAAPSHHRRHWHPHCTNWRAHPSPPHGHHYRQQAGPSICALSPVSARCCHWCGAAVALATCVTSTSSSLSSSPSCRHGTGHLRHVVIVVVMAPSLSPLPLLLSPSCLIAIVPPWHWPPCDFVVDVWWWPVVVVDTGGSGCRHVVVVAVDAWWWSRCSCGPSVALRCL